MIQQRATDGSRLARQSVFSTARLPQSISSPKRSRKTNNQAFGYYAGFSEAFVREILNMFALDSADVVVDPWVGSGTTVRVAGELGIAAIGLDINPAMVVLSKARLVSTADAPAIGRALRQLSASRCHACDPDLDPLTVWFDHRTTVMIRGLEQCIANQSQGQAIDNVNDMLPVQAHLYAALFVATRRAIRPYIGSNPTWVRTVSKPEDRIAVSASTLRRHVMGASELLLADAMPTRPQRLTVKLGSSSDLPSDLPRTRLIMGSPPYCTRIDYAVATRPELAVLNMSTDDQAALRRSMLGTTTVPCAVAAPLDQLGTLCAETLRKVAQHSSKASASYYWKWLAQYFLGYATSLRQLVEIMDSDGAIVLVVQDSYYKDVHLDLAAITEEMMSQFGWTKAKRYSFNLARTMAGINRGARKYRREFGGSENVLIFRKTMEA